MKRLLTLLASLGPVACLPPAEDAGQVDPTESGSAGADATSTDGGATATDAADGATGMDVPLDPSIEWSLELSTEPNSYIIPMVRSADGVVAVRHGLPLVTSPEILEVSADMEVLWSRTLDDAGVGDLKAMGGGQYLLAGSTRMDDVEVPTAWRLSCCGGSEHTSFPVGVTDVPASVQVIEPRAGGIFMAVYAPGPTGPASAFIQSELDFGPSPGSELGTHAGNVWDSALTASGSVLVSASVEGAYVFYEVATDGTVTQLQRDRATVLVGSGDDLTLLSFGNHELQLEPYGGGPLVEVPIPGLEYEAYAVDRRERFAFVHSTEEPEGGSTAHVVEFDASGVVLRELDLPHLLQGDSYCTSTALAVGEDDAIYVAMSESVPDDGPSALWIHRIAPL